MPLLMLTITFIIAVLFAKLLDKSASHSFDTQSVVYRRKNKLGMIVGSMGLVTCILLILFLTVIQ